MFEDILPDRPSAASATSPTTMARQIIAAQKLSEIERVLSQILLQCDQIKMIAPFFRFVHSVLTESFEVINFNEIFDKFATELPDIFRITTKLKGCVFNRLRLCADATAGPPLSIKTLQHVLRITLADTRFYRGTKSDQLGVDKIRLAKRNLSQLLKQLDFYNVLPPDQAGLLRSSFRFQSMLYVPDSTLETSTLNTETDTIIDFVKTMERNYVIYSSTWGINELVALPIMNVVTKKDDDEVTRHLMDLFSPFNKDVYPIRFALGEVKPAGRCHFYERVPLSSSISYNEPDLPPHTGSLGVYLRDASEPAARWFLTAGHIARADPAQTHTTLYAPPTRPYEEAKRSVSEALTRAIEADNRKAEATLKKQMDNVVNLDRTFGTVEYVSAKTSDVSPFYKEDIALVRTRAERAADNSLRRLSSYTATQHFKAGGNDIPSTTAPPNVRTMVSKVGIRTGYTEGIIAPPSTVSWHPTMTSAVPEEDPLFGSVHESMAHTIISSEGEYFADEGDSGSPVVTFTKDVEGKVEKTSAIGIVYAIVVEDEMVPTRTFFYPMDDILNKLKSETGRNLELDSSVIEGSEPWPFVEYGSGRSTFDLK